MIILPTCVAVVVLGLSINWLVKKIRKTSTANRNKATEREKPIQLTIAEEPHTSSLSLPANEEEPDDTPKTLKPDSDTNIDDRSSGGVEELPNSVYRQRDDEWLNAEDDLPQPSVRDSALLAGPGSSDFQIEQDGPVINITVTTSIQGSPKQQTIVNFKIKVPPNYLAVKGEGPYDMEIVADESIIPFESLGDEVTAGHVKEDADQGNLLADGLSVVPVQEEDFEGQALEDEIAVRPVESPVTEHRQFIDDLVIKSDPEEAPDGMGLGDRITVRPVENPAGVIPSLMDSVTVRSIGEGAGEIRALGDAITIKPSRGPVNLEYELLDDLITKRANDGQTGRVSRIDGEGEVGRTVGIDEIKEILGETGSYRRAATPESVIEWPSFPSPIGSPGQTPHPVADGEMSHSLQESKGFEQATTYDAATEVPYYPRKKGRFERATFPRVAVEPKSLPRLPRVKTESLLEVLQLILVRGKVVSAVLGLLIIFGIIGSIYIVVRPNPSDITQFYLLGPNGQASNYPKEVAIGQEANVKLGIYNRQDQASTCRIEVLVDATLSQEIGPFSIGKGEKWEQDVSFVPTKPGLNEKVEFILYTGESGQEYFGSLKLVIDVK